MANTRIGGDKPVDERKQEEEKKLKAILECFNYDKALSRLELKNVAIKIKPDELALRLRDALLYLGIVHLDLSLAQIAVTAENENDLGNLNMNLQEKLLAEVTEYLGKANCKLETLTLDGWDVVGLVDSKAGIKFKMEHKSNILKDLGQAIRVNSSLKELSLESSHLTSANIKTFFQFLYGNLKDEKPNKGKSQLAAIGLGGNIDSSRTDQADQAEEIELIAGKTDIAIRWDWEYANKPDEPSAPLKISSPKPQNGEPKKSSGEAPADKTANDEAAPLGSISLGVDVTDDMQPQPKNYSSEGILHAFINAFRQRAISRDSKDASEGRSASRYAKYISAFGVGGLLAGGVFGGLAALGGYIGTTAGVATVIIAGVALSTTVVGLFVGGIILAGCLFAGIAYGIYLAEREHRGMVNNALRPSTSPLIARSSSADIMDATQAQSLPTPAIRIDAPAADSSNSGSPVALPRTPSFGKFQAYDVSPSSSPAQAASGFASVTTDATASAAAGEEQQPEMDFSL